MGFIIKIQVTSDDYIQQPHKDKTNWIIERAVEWIEEQDEPFTIASCWRAVGGHYQCISQVVRSMARNGLIVHLNPGSVPKLWIRFDRE